MVVCWDDLDPSTYAHQLTELTDWISWLRATYRIPATVLPPCWFTHPGLREDIGHLWTGWLLTRHPDAGVGMIGLDWDQRREAAISRLREATAITGCTATRHQAEPEPPPAMSASAEQLWQNHLDTQTRQRVHAVARQAAVDQAVAILQAAELRHELAPAVLAAVADDPANAGDDDRARVAERLRQLADDAVERAAQSALDAVRTVLDAHQHSAREGLVAEARDDLAHLFATATPTDQAPAGSDELAQRWLDALEKLLPAVIAADRAAAAANARTAAVDQRVARRRRSDIDDLLP
ncbi:hypothetical protein Namu_0455 [Nakamurella multipartita DSM 44233]|uniref:Uncharacterized protein n=2 Tax=Nakamurella TaxID=53460 RepID=C8X6A4_NAKMY|nr:hypothetical protein Namu_0455 [Nakamurella multipartita DSM 44233]